MTDANRTPPAGTTAGTTAGAPQASTREPSAEPGADASAATVAASAKDRPPAADPIATTIKGHAPAPAANAPVQDAAPASQSHGAEPDDILDRNVESLLSKADQPPRISDAARARIRETLLAQPLAQAHAQAASVEGGHSALATARARKRARAFALGGGAAAAVAAAAAIAFVVRTPGGPSGASQGSAAQATARDDLRVLDDGTTAELSPGAELEVLGARKVRVSGKILFDVVPGKGRFTVETPSGTVTALGTRFVVEAEAEATLAAVIRGSVALASAVKSAADSASELVLAAGEGGRIARGQPPVRQPVPRLSHLTSWVKALRDKQERPGDLPGAARGTLFARDPNRPGLGESPLPMKQLTVDVVVEHRVARVAIDHTFFNPNPSVLEGNYRFAIPPDAALQRFAMYVDGKLNEAAVVERMRARRVYEDLVYVRQVDPALLEYAGVGKLAMRVYPLPPQQEKRIALAYTQTLPQLYDTWTLAVPLPKIDGAVDDVRFALHLGDCANCEVASPSHQLQVNRSGQTLELSYQAQGSPPGDTLLVNVRERRDRPSVDRQLDGADLYLQVRAPAELPKPATDAARKRRHWIVLNDVSASRGPLERRAQAELAGALIGELDEEDRVAVLDFDVAVRDILPFQRVLDVDRDALAAKLRDDDGGVGATDAAAALDAALARFTAEAAKSGAAQPVILYLGDGVVTAGPRQLDELRSHLAGKAMFVGIGLGEGPDTMTLGALAGATGGLMATIDLSDDLRWRAFDLIATLNTPRVTGLTAQLFDGDGKGLPGALLRSPQLADGEELEVVAKLPAATPAAALELRGTLDGAPWQQRISLDAPAAAAGAITADDRAGYVPRLWAQREIERLLLAKHEPAPMPVCNKQPCPTEAEVREQRNEQLRLQIVELGKRFFLLSRHTSLIVLENDAMYDEYGVKKGSGQTWAPYALPPTIPVVKPAPQGTPPLAAPAPQSASGELTRQSWLGLAETPFGVPSGRFETRGTTRKILSREENKAGTGSGYGTIGAGSGGGGKRAIEADKAPMAEAEKAERNAGLADDGAASERARRGDSVADFDREAQFAGASAGSASSGPPPPPATPAPAAPAAPAAVVAPSESQPSADAVAAARKATTTTSTATMGAGRASRASYFYPGGDLVSFLTPQALPGARYLRRAMLEDVTELVPAMVLDELQASTDRIRQARGNTAPAAIPTAAEPAALQLLDRARAAIPSGTYRWGEYVFALDDAYHLGWKRVLSDGLEETAGFDGTRLTRRYAELGLDVASRHEGSDALAISLTFFPLWLPPAEALRQGFAITMSGKDVLLTAPDQSLPAFRLSFDGDRLRRISDGTGHVLAEVIWAQSGAPIAASFGGPSLPLSFTAPATGAARSSRAAGRGAAAGTGTAAAGTGTAAAGPGGSAARPGGSAAGPGGSAAGTGGSAAGPGGSAARPGGSAADTRGSAAGPGGSGSSAPGAAGSAGGGDAATALLAPLGSGSASSDPGAAASGVTVDLPIRPVAVRTAELSAQMPGTPAWRRAMHQLLASLVTARAWNDLRSQGKALLDTGTLWPGEQSLLSGALHLLSIEEREAYSRGDSPIARYLEVQRLSERRTKTRSISQPASTQRGRSVQYRPGGAQRRAPGVIANAPDDAALPPPTGVSGGALGSLNIVRQALALAEAGQTGAALIRASALPANARLWRVLCATTFTGRTYNRDVQSLAALWSSLDGDLVNIGRYQAAVTLLQHSNWSRSELDAAAAEMAALFENLDLTALPPPADASISYWFSQSSRGVAGWRATYTRWRDRVLTDGDLGHVLALLRALPYDADGDLLRILDRASALAGGDADQVLAIAVLAASRGQAEWALAYLNPYVDRAAQLVAASNQPATTGAGVAAPSAAAPSTAPSTSSMPAVPAPAARSTEPLDPWTSHRPTTPASDDLPAAASPDLLRLASQLAQQLGQPTAALQALQTAIAMDGGGTIADYTRLLQLSREIAISTAPAERAPVIARAERWARDWRAADPGGSADPMLAQLLFAVGDNDGAFRVLSSNIDRDPMSGDAWGAIAAQFESAGLVDRSLPYWHEAVILDQTNPTWRIRNARALSAVGRKAEAQQILTEVLRRRWHDRWQWTLYEARELSRQLGT